MKLAGSRIAVVTLPSKSEDLGGCGERPPFLLMQNAAFLRPEAGVGAGMG
jgi:hypothetical protein